MSVLCSMALSLYYTLKKYDDKLHETKKYPIVGEVWNETLHPVVRFLILADSWYEDSFFVILYYIL